MKIIGKITVDKTPESCSVCNFVSDGYGYNSEWKCELNNCSIKKINKYLKRPHWCKLIQK